MQFSSVEPMPERDRHLALQWASGSGLVHICVEPIVGAVRVQVYYERPDALYPDILQCTWDTPPDQRLMQIVEHVLAALSELPELADQRAVQTRLHILMFEEYGDIYDGVKARPIDRDHPDHNPRANPWWNDAQALREQLDSGVYRHHLPLNLEAPPLGDTWVELKKPEPEPEVEALDGYFEHEGHTIHGEFDPEGRFTPHEWARPLDEEVEEAIRERNSALGAHPDDVDWLEQTWVNERAEGDPKRPNPSWRGPPKPYTE